MRFISILIFTLIAGVAFAKKSAEYIYQCPSSAAYKAALISGKALKLCPEGQKTCRKQRKIEMHAYLKGYGGYPPSDKWRVIKAHSYNNGQCRYAVIITKTNRSEKKATGYVRVEPVEQVTCKQIAHHQKKFKCRLHVEHYKR